METVVADRVEVRVGGSSRDEEFVAFVEAHGPYLFRTAYFLAGDRTLAEDLVQGTFERVYRRWDKARNGDPRAYARKVLVNLRTDTWRRTRLTDVPGDEHLPVAHADDHAARVSLRDELARALGSLTPQQRRVVVLRHVLDLPEAQVAQEIGRSVGTVKSASSRGLERLRTLLTDVVPEAADEPTFDGRETLTRSKAAVARRVRRDRALAAAAVAVCALVALLAHGPTGVPMLDAVTGPAHRWLVATFSVPVDTEAEGPVRDVSAVTAPDDAVGLGDVDVPAAAALPADTCAGTDVPTPDPTRTVPVPGDAPTGDFTVVRTLDADDARPAVECLDHVTEHRAELGTPPAVMLSGAYGSTLQVPFTVRADGTLAAALPRPDVPAGSEPVTALVRPAADGDGFEHWQLSAAATGPAVEPRRYAAVPDPVLTDTHVAWVDGDVDLGPASVRVQDPDGAVRTVARFEGETEGTLWKIAAGGRTLAIVRLTDDLGAVDRCMGRVDLVDLDAPDGAVERDVVTDVCAVSDGADGVVVTRNPADGPSEVGLLTVEDGLRTFAEVDQELAWNSYAFASGDTVLFEVGTWMVALDAAAHEATVVREDGGWTVGATHDGVVWADGDRILFLRLAPRDGVPDPALTALGPDDGATSWLDVAAAGDRVVWVEHDRAELEQLQSGDSFSYGDLEQSLVTVRTSW